MQNTLLVFKPLKHKSRKLSTAHSSQDLCNNRAYFITDSRSQAYCFVDTGAACSIWPLELLTEKPTVSPITLQAANPSPIPTYGQISGSLDLELRRDFTWVFTVADLPYLILGLDFLYHFNLLVDMRKRRLIDANTELFVNNQPGIFHCCHRRPIPNLITLLPKVNKYEFCCEHASTHNNSSH